MINENYGLFLIQVEMMCFIVFMVYIFEVSGRLVLSFIFFGVMRFDENIVVRYRLFFVYVG